jgi:hypothetical protein
MDDVLHKTRPAEIALDIFFVINMFINCCSGKLKDEDDDDEDVSLVCKSNYEF